MDNGRTFTRMDLHLDREMIEQIDAAKKAREARAGGLSIPRAAIIRELLRAGLQAEAKP